jgi:hypothetical protein
VNQADHHHGEREQECHLRRVLVGVGEHDRRASQHDVGARVPLRGDDGLKLRVQLRVGKVD